MKQGGEKRCEDCYTKNTWSEGATQKSSELRGWGGGDQADSRNWGVRRVARAWDVSNARSEKPGDWEKK